MWGTHVALTYVKLQNIFNMTPVNLINVLLACWKSPSHCGTTKEERAVSCPDASRSVKAFDLPMEEAEARPERKASTGSTSLKGASSVRPDST